MRKHLLYFLLVFISASGKTQNTTDSQKPLRIVLFTNDGNFFEEYPLDTLAAHLNLLNNTPSITYTVKAKNQQPENNNSVWIHLTLQENNHAATGVSFKEQVVRRPVMQAVVSPGGQVSYVLASQDDHIELIPKQTGPESTIYLTLEAFRNEPYKKLRYRHWTVKGGLETKSALIIKLIKDIDLFVNDRVAKMH
jgi:hypothetical protein